MHVNEYHIADKPWFDEEGTTFFVNAVKGIETYLEFGSGGSTVFASKVARNVVSVENNFGFAEAVRAKLSDENRGVTIFRLESDNKNSTLCRSLIYRYPSFSEIQPVVHAYR
jgi:hypothetical protein